ncbi:MAG: agmatine deiminase family protein [Methylococcaceae bacterium]
MSTSFLSHYLIPEWEEQSAVLLAWPYAGGDFNPWLSSVEDTYERITLAISQRQIVLILCRDDLHASQLKQRFQAHASESSNLRFIPLAYDDVWVRDTAPLSIRLGTVVLHLDFRFNGWGEKYPHEHDAQLAKNLCSTGILGNTRLKPVDFVLEGGSIESDGLGTIMTTRRCLLNPNRNPGYNPQEIEGFLCAELGAIRILWLNHGHAEGDDTDAHIDTLARFCSVDTIAYTACDDPEDSLYAEFKAMELELQSFTRPNGEPYRLVPLPIPRPIHSESGDRLPATYANFLVINGAVLVPVYDDPADEQALSLIQSCFPDRNIIPIPSIPLIRQYGSIHCMTMQFPKA